jgi:hypothetical protein
VSSPFRTSADDPSFWDHEVFFPQAMHLRNEDGAIVPMHLRPVQRILNAAVQRCYAENRWLAFVKPRKVGSSVFFTGVVTQHAAFRNGCYAAILAHKNDVAQELAMVAIRFHERMPKDIRPRKTRGLKRTLEFPDIDSKLDIASVKDDEPLRGSTGIQALVATEISSWGESGGPDAWTSVLSNVPREGGFVVGESTPKHENDQLHVLWKEADRPGSKWLKVFAPWTLVDEYQVDPPPYWSPSADVAAYAHRHLLTPAQAFWMQTEGLSKCANRLDKFMAEYPINEIECWQMAGDCVFDRDKLTAQLQARDEGTALSSEVNAYEEFVEPKDGHKYIIFCDPSGSWAERDMHGVEVLDVDTCEQVAEYLGHESAYLHARRLADMGLRYNKATIYVEANGVGEAVLSHLMALRYPRVFHHPRSDGKKPGWWSSQKSKAEAVSMLSELIYDGSIKLYSQRGIRQLVAYRGQWDKLSRDVQGGHFDLAAALCGAAWAWRHEVGGRYQRGLADPDAVFHQWWSKFKDRVTGNLGHRDGDTRWGRHV